MENIDSKMKAAIMAAGMHTKKPTVEYHSGLGEISGAFDKKYSQQNIQSDVFRLHDEIERDSDGYQPILTSTRYEWSFYS